MDLLKSPSKKRGGGKERNQPPPVSDFLEKENNEKK